MYYVNVILLSAGTISENILFLGEDHREVTKRAEAKFIEMSRKLREIGDDEINDYLMDGFCTDADEVVEVCISVPEWFMQN